jgi:N-hydroxyarylamine O-acetyltransferase
MCGSSSADKYDNSCNDTDDNDVCQDFRRRLDLVDEDLSPTFSTLCLITERHLERIPFTNLSLHLNRKRGTNTADNPILPPVALEQDALIERILRQGRGAVCLELNGLLAVFLRHLGYRVDLVPCYVAAGRERGHGSTTQPKFRTTPSHFVLLVNRNYWLDVGLGEPPIHPLRYEVDTIQHTPDGMVSRIRWDPKGSWVDGKGITRTCLIQEWRVDRCNNYATVNTENDAFTWEPRLQWDEADAPLDKVTSPKTTYTLQDFAYVTKLLTHVKSSFARKFIACRLTRTQKTSLSGTRLKTTTPRFGRGSQVHYTDLPTEEAVRLALHEHFGIALCDHETLNLTQSTHAHNTKLWDHL